MDVAKLLEVYKDLSMEDRILFERGRKRVIFDEESKKLEEKRKMIASSLSQIVDENDKPYISADWIKKNIFGLDENDINM
jgi:DNA-binding transcriptional regulator YhcF (GntR family)